MGDLFHLDINGDGIIDELDFDMNGDGVINQQDFDLINAGLDNNPDFDLNGDGIVNGLDFDLNGDGVIDRQDADMAEAMMRADADLTTAVNGGGAQSEVLYGAQTGEDWAGGGAFGGIAGKLGEAAGELAKPSLISDVVNVIQQKFDEMLGSDGSGSTGGGADLEDSVGAYAAGEADADTDIAGDADMEGGAAGLISSPHTVSFGASSLSHESWQDGASYSEITPEIISGMSGKMADMFGEYGIDVHQINGFENAAMTMGEDANLLFDPNLLWSLGRQHGTDAITGVIAHEIGHHIVDTTLDTNSVSDWHHELCADYIAGIISQFHGVDHGVMESMFADGNFASASDSHPNGGLRSEAYGLGVSWAQNHTNDVFSEFLLKDSTELGGMFMSDIISSFPASYGEYAGM